MSTHGLYDEDSPVRPGCGTEAVDFFGDNLDSRFEPQTVVGSGKILVDGFWNTDDLNAHLGKLESHAQTILSTNHHESLYAKILEVIEYLFPSVVTGVKGVGSRCAQIRSPVAIPGSHSLLIQRDDIFPDAFLPSWIDVCDPSPALSDSNHLKFNIPLSLKSGIQSGFDHPLDGRVQAGAITPTR